jgi:hypothetical protein
MYLLIINLYELGQYLRILLWIALPASIVWMLVTTFLQYRRSWKEQSGLRLAIEGGAAEGGRLEGERLEGERFEGERFEGERLEGERFEGERFEGERFEAGRFEAGPFGASPVEEGPEDENIEWNEGNENMYRGILWMKEKYEQYREVTDQRYERLREELGRSEQRYQDLLLKMEQSGGPSSGAGQAQGAVLDRRAGQARGGGKDRGAGQPHGGAQSPGVVERAYGVEEPHPYDLLAGELNAKQAVIEELEEQLRVERLRVEELIFKLQTNGQLLQQIYIELDKSYGMSRPSAPLE